MAAAALEGELNGHRQVLSGGVLQLQDMASVNRICIPAPALCSGDVFIPHFPPSAIRAVALAGEVNIPHFLPSTPPGGGYRWQEMEP